MPRTVRTVTTLTPNAATTIVGSAADNVNGEVVQWTDDLRLHVTSTTTTAVTIVTPGTVAGQAINDLVVTADPTPKIIGPLSTAFRDANGNVQIDYDNANATVFAHRA